MSKPSAIFDEKFEQLKRSMTAALNERLESELRAFTALNGSEREKRYFAWIDNQKGLLRNLRYQRKVLLNTLKTIAEDGNPFAKAMVEQFEAAGVKSDERDTRRSD